MQLRFCQGRPHSAQTILFLQQLLALARNENKRVLIVIWDHASWHKSKRVKRWIRHYNRQAKQVDDVRLLTWLLPTKSPWLNPIEPRWLHGKRAVLEAGEADLTVAELQRRLCAYYQVEFALLYSNLLC